MTKPVNIATYLAAAMLTYYFRNPEDALKQAKADSKHPGCYFGGITLPSGKRGFAVYKDGKIVTQCVYFKDENKRLLPNSQK